MDPADTSRLQEWLRRAPRDDRLRPAVQSHLDGRPLSADDLWVPVAHLESPGEYWWRSVAVAAALVGRSELSAEHRARALPALRRLAAREPPVGGLHGTTDGAGCGCGTTIGLWVGAVLGMYLIGADAGYITSGLIALLILGGLAALPIGLIIGAVDDSRARVALREQAVRALGLLGDPDSGGVLAVGCCELNESIQRAAQEALSRVLPGLTEAHYRALEPRVVPQLCSALLVCTDPHELVWPRGLGLVRPILDAFERMGDGRAVEAVRRMVAQCPDAALQARAREVLPILVERQAQERASARLLRPADAPGAASGDLLRPAEPGPEVQAEHLLRPAERDDQ